MKTNNKLQLRMSCGHGDLNLLPSNKISPHLVPLKVLMYSVDLIAFLILFFQVAMVGAAAAGKL